MLCLDDDSVVLRRIEPWLSFPDVDSADLSLLRSRFPGLMWTLQSCPDWDQADISCYGIHCPVLIRSELSCHDVALAVYS